MYSTLPPALDEEQSMDPFNMTVRNHGPIRALCVDDNRDAADTLAAVLELMGCETRTCYSGLDALRAFPEFHPDVCFLDLCMPEMDGLELAAQMRTHAGCRALFLVAVTALGSLEDQIRTALTGFHFHLVKPFDGVALATLLNQFSEVLRRDPKAEEALPVPDSVI